MKQNNIYQTVTDKIISMLDKVVADDFKAPFAELAAQGMPLNPVTGNHYQGVNILSLWFDQEELGYSSNHWATFKQWKDNGAQIKKGEKGSRIIFYKKLLVEEEGEEVHIPMLRLYTVFNVAQVEGYEDQNASRDTQIDLVERIKLADQFCKNTGASIIHNENRAYYSRTFDFINMPPTNAFVDTDSRTATQSYYSILFHELTHWTGSKTRLDRDKAKRKTEVEKYAKEELIAELGAAFLCAQLGITQSPKEDHAMYMKGWLSALKDDPKFIFSASAQANKAVEYLNKLQPSNNF